MVLVVQKLCSKTSSPLYLMQNNSVVLGPIILYLCAVEQMMKEMNRVDES